MKKNVLTRPSLKLKCNFHEFVKDTKEKVIYEKRYL